MQSQNFESNLPLAIACHHQNHPLDSGLWVTSPGAHFTYQIVGPCCRLFDRAELPWPCCRLQWRGKEPSWRRVGRRFVADLATKNFPSYGVRILEGGQWGSIVVMTFYGERLSPDLKAWWYSSRWSSWGPGAMAQESGMPQGHHPAPQSTETAV
jgi:hypothetical protein